MESRRLLRLDSQVSGSSYPRSDVNNTADKNCFSRHQVTILLLVPSVIHQMVNHPKIHTTDFSTITHVASGAAYLPPELSKVLTNRVRNNGVTEGYGMSEAVRSVVFFLLGFLIDVLWHDCRRCPLLGNLPSPPLRDASSLSLVHVVSLSPVWRARSSVMTARKLT